MEQDREPRHKPAPPMSTLFLKKAARIHNRAKIASLISDAGKTGQLHAKE